MKKNLFGFTLPELLIVLTILASLFGLTSINMLNAYHKNSLGTSVTSLVNDLKHQQLKAMIGDTEGQASANDYGVYFTSDGLSYTLFQGNSYSVSDPANFSINLNRDLRFSSIMLQNSQIIFAKGSGEFSNFNVNFDNITLTNVRTDETKTIRINQLGNIINVY